MTLANKVTISRLLFGPIFLLGEFLKFKIISLLALFLNILGDFLDGFLARKRGEKTKVGEVLDPAVDLVFFGFVALSFSKDFTPINLFLIPIFFILLTFFLPLLFKRKIQVFHMKTKFFHTPLIYLISLLLSLEVFGRFFAILFLLTFLCFFFGALESFFRCLRFLFKENGRSS